jgi:hypothetical protein
MKSFKIFIIFLIILEVNQLMKADEIPTTAPSQASEAPQQTSDALTTSEAQQTSEILLTTTLIPTTTLPPTTELPTTSTTTSTTTGTTTTTTTTKPSRPTPSSTQTTTQIRPALRYFKGEMTTRIPEDCFSFKFSRISQDCCKMPKFEFSSSVVSKCKSECENSKSSHCCVTDCKYREMGIYSSEKGFDKVGIIKGFKTDKEWEKIVEKSVDFCVKDQDSKDTTTQPPTTVRNFFIPN